MNIKKISLFTPYPKKLNDEVFDFFVNENFIITSNSYFNIKSDIANYNKKEQILNFIDKVKLSDLSNNLYIEGDKMKYEKDKDLFYSYGNTKFNINDKYIIFSKNVFYNRNTQTIYGDDFTKIEDDQKNIFKLKDGFIFDIEKELLLALMGIETNFGKYLGKMDIISSLATLSYDQRRSEFFKINGAIVIKSILAKISLSKFN